MNVDIYKLKGSKGYIFIESGADITKIDIDTEIEVTPFKINKDIISRPSLIGADPNQIISDIQNIGYSIKGVDVISVEINKNAT
ncbi:MAG: hypothetical protein AB2598_20830 [Candidatus Thiodiazotropha sp.]